jgi:hypothetical protein
MVPGVGGRGRTASWLSWSVMELCFEVEVGEETGAEIVSKKTLADGMGWGGREPGLEAKANDSARIHHGAPSQSVHGSVAVLTEQKLV